MDDVLSNKRWKGSLQFLRVSPIVSTKSLAWIWAQCIYKVTYTVYLQSHLYGVFTKSLVQCIYKVTCTVYLQSHLYSVFTKSLVQCIYKVTYTVYLQSHLYSVFTKSRVQCIYKVFCIRSINFVLYFVNVWNLIIK
jgi:hypothetical protein